MQVRSDDCPICKASLCKSEIVQVLCCKHRFHSSCISDWIKFKKTCPTCRAVIGLHTDQHRMVEHDKCAMYSSNNQFSPDPEPLTLSMIISSMIINSGTHHILADVEEGQFDILMFLLEEPIEIQQQLSQIPLTLDHLLPLYNVLGSSDILHFTNAEFLQIQSFTIEYLSQLLLGEDENGDHNDDFESFRLRL